MKRFNLVHWLMLIFWVCCGTLSAQKVVFVENFDSDGLPEQWSQVGSVWNCTAGNAVFSSTLANAEDILCSPVVDISSLEHNPMVALRLKQPSLQSLVDPLTVCYRLPESADWIPLQTFSAALEDYTTVAVLLPNVPKLHIGLQAQNNAAGGIYIDYLQVQNSPYCSQPVTGLTLLSTYLKPKSAALLWDVSMVDQMIGYNIKVSTTPISDFLQKADVAEYTGYLDESIALENLTPNTEYWFYIQTDCDDNDVSPWASLSFVTPCEQITAPLFFDFEDATLGSCWSTSVSGSTVPSYIPSLKTTYPYEGKQSLYFYTGSAATSYVFLPEIAEDITNYQISFMAATNNAGELYARQIHVGVATSHDPASVQEWQTFDLPKAQKWEKLTVSFEGYQGAGRYIVLYTGKTGQTNHMFVDNLSIEQASDCENVMFPTCKQALSTQATIGWTDSKPTASEWYLLVANKEITDFTSLTSDSPEVVFYNKVTSNPYTITGLTQLTTYWFYVASACDPDNFVQGGSFKTPQQATVPYVQHFDQYPNEIYTNNTSALPTDIVVDTRYMSSNNDYWSTSSSYATYLTTAYNNESTPYKAASLRVKGADNYVQFAILPEISGAEVNQLMLSFYVYAKSATTITYNVGVMDVQDGRLPRGQMLSEGGHFTFVKQVNVKTLANKWVKVEAPLTNYKGNGKFITFWTPYSEHYIDDITVDYTPACLTVDNLQAEVLSNYAIKFTWEERSFASSWDIKVSSVAMTDMTQTADLGDGEWDEGTTFVQEGLNPGQTVYFYVRPHGCDVEWQSVYANTIHALNVPYVNNFDSPNKTWSELKLGNFTSKTLPTVGTTKWTNAPANVTPNSIIFKHSASSGINGYLRLPEYIDGDVKDLVVSFYGYMPNDINSSNCAGRLKVGVLTDTTDFTTLTPVQSVSLSKGKTPEFFVVPLNSYEGAGKFIVLYDDTVVGTSVTNTFYLDNLSITDKNTLQSPSNIVALETAPTEIKLGWKENGTATAWNVRVFSGKGSNPDTDAPVFSATVNNQPEVLVTGLQHSTPYYVYVQARSGDALGPWSSMECIWSGCAPMALPWKEDFNDYEVGTVSFNVLPPCYEVLTSVATQMPFVAASSGSSYAGDHTYPGDNTKKVFKMSASMSASASASSATMQGLELPEFELPVNQLHLRFYVSGTKACSTQPDASDNYGPWLRIGVREDDGSFTEVKQYFHPVANAWAECDVMFDTYKGTGKNIVIWYDRETWLNNNWYNKASISIFLDDIMVEQIPSCRRVETVWVEKADSLTATIRWNKTYNETLYNVKVTTAESFHPESQEGDVFDGQLNETQLKLSGLKSGTNHYVYVQAVDPANDCQGEWSVPVNFFTWWSPLPLPYAEDFEKYAANAIPSPYYYYTGYEATFAKVLATNTTISSVDGISKRHLNVYPTKDKNDYWVLPAMQIDSVKNLQLHLWVNAKSAKVNYFEVGVMSDPTNPATFTPVHYDSVIYVSGTRVWQERYYAFDTYKGGDLIYNEETGQFEPDYGNFIAIHVPNLKMASESVARGDMYFDNIEITLREECIAPMALIMEECSTDTAKCSWTALDEQTSFRLRVFNYLPDNADADDFIFETVVADTLSATVKGLLPNTPYYAFVRSECSAIINSAWSTGLRFRTDCPAKLTLPYYDDFENYLTEYVSSTMPSCWTHTTGVSSLHAPTDSDPVFDGKYAMLIAGAYNSSASSTKGDMVILPEVDVDSLSHVFLYFFGYAHSGARMNIYAVNTNDYMDNPEADRELIVSMEIPTTWRKYLPYYIDLSGYKSLKNYKYIGIESYGSLLIDNLLISNDRTINFPITDLKMTEVGDVYAAYSFFELNDQVTAWQAEYGPAGFALGTGIRKQISLSTDTLTGLTPNTSYDIYVRVDKDDAEWTAPLTFTTTKGIATLPYVDTFTDEVSNAQWNYSPEAGGKNYLWMYRTIRVEEPVVLLATSEFDAVPSGGYVSLAILPTSVAIEGSSLRHENGYITGIVKNGAPDNNEYTLVYQHKETEPATVNAKVTVTQPGLYNLMYQITATSALVAAKPDYIKAITIEEYDCVAPSNIRLTAIDADSAVFTWAAGKSNDFEVMVAASNMGDPFQLDETDEYVTLRQTIQGNTFVAKGLKPTTPYSLYIRTLCVDSYTEFVEYPFATNCGVQPLPYAESFDAEPSCWIIYGETNPDKYLNYAYNHAYTINSPTKTVYNIAANSTIVLPVFDVPVNTMRISFSFASGESTVSTPVSLSLGVMNDQLDTDSFEELLPLVTTFITNSSTKVFDVCDFKLHNYIGKGKVLALRSSNKPVIIDDLTITEIPEFIDPENIVVTNITQTTAQVGWMNGSNETSWLVRLSQDGNEVVIPVTDNPCTLTNLTHSTVYSVQVAAVYENGVSEYSRPVEFTTECGTWDMPFDEDFATLKQDGPVSLLCWNSQISEGTLDDVLDNGATLTYVPTSLSYTYHWRSNSTTKAEDKSILSSENYVNNRWLITPEFAIVDNALLTFDLWYTIAKPLGQFAVLVSLDNGLSWQRQDATLFNNVQIPSAAATQQIDLSRYAGKNVRIAFFHAVTSKDSKSILHIDNVRLNCVERNEYTDNVCETYPYEGYGFTVEADKHSVSQPLVLSQWVRSDNNGCDNIVTLTLTTLPSVEETINAAICKNQTYLYEDVEYTIGEHIIRSFTEEGCNKVTYLNLTESSDCIGSSIENVSAATLSVTPNPVLSGSDITITGKFTAEQMEGMTLYLYNGNGSLVSTLKPDRLPLQIKVVGDAGVYLVRLTTAQGENHTAKFVVK
ncbi:MAG: fibronectin type III domain-containing protein [Paludibacter sp.]|nr:fibronectin type III domain-containing protein [Bacteroidales bacterium]MCM1069249.1 fibronectin type III domain-containing protein [Prevotella sp.]MCM1353768.1 fibronectin type III domain-containing protein [Bacteroides sp.]MCM1442164.1 fibronectin type III domain-containing protein [Muribaculum sp.]MCM1482539.1 fibronectin type III domain-containing protein [Paludibacter sp.]